MIRAVEEDHWELMLRAVDREGEGHRAALRGDVVGAQVAYWRAVEAYRASWGAAPPEAYGRLIGLVKASVLAGGGGGEGAYARAAGGDEAAGGAPAAADGRGVGGPGGRASGSPAAAYVRAMAALVAGDDGEAARWAEVMRGGSEAFGRAAEAIAALAAGDGPRYHDAALAIVHDFEARADHLTGVAFADTVAMLETLAA